MGVELLLEDVKALEAVFAKRNKLSVKGLEGVKRADFGHGQNAVDSWRIATAVGVWSRGKSGDGGRRRRWSGAFDVVVCCLSPEAFQG